MHQHSVVCWLILQKSHKNTMKSAVVTWQNVTYSGDTGVFLNTAVVSAKEERNHVVEWDVSRWNNSNKHVDWRLHIFSPQADWEYVSDNGTNIHVQYLHIEQNAHKKFRTYQIDQWPSWVSVLQENKQDETLIPWVPIHYNSSCCL